ncbi:hypothetical protein ANAEL_05907 [Anaerolineales bacterium]|nr:hypothetical protein ANAEL_05907 [Anaerolineales bacterium]
MGLFGKILEKLGLKKGEEETKPTASAKPSNPTITMVNKPATAGPVKPKPVAAQKDEMDDMPKSAMAQAPAPTPMSEVDVVKKLEQMAAGSGLDWKVSIVDLLKVLGIDSSREARNELATELGCPADLMKDSAKMNVWLHKEVLKQIAANGGNIPKNLLD